MDTSTYVALSGQLALDKRLATIANNVANAKTIGFRAQGVNFEDILSGTSRFETAFASAGKEHVVLAQGGITRTGNPLDVAISGSGFLAVQNGGQVSYTRDGRLSLSATGELLSTTGGNVLDAGGQPITLDPSAGALQIARDGSIFQGTNKLAQLGLFELDLSKGFARSSGSGVVPKLAPVAVTDFRTTSVVQGHVEEANVSPITEMVKLIQVTRAFEAASTLSGKSLEAEMEAIRALGAR
jgi:flagellar basal-body rod protein FlgF